jgi:hypothetical protein
MPARQKLAYTIIEKTVVIKRKTRATLTNALPSAPIDIKGRIVNENGEPVAGASVKIKGTNIGTSTNENGEFALNVPDPNMILVITAVNIEPINTS